MHQVVPRRAAFGHAKTHDERHARRRAALDFGAWESVATTVILKGLAARFSRWSLFLELLGCAEAPIGAVGVQQALDVGLMALEVRSLMHDLLLPAQAEPLEALEDGARALFGAAYFIGVLDAQQEL